MAWHGVAAAIGSLADGFAVPRVPIAKNRTHAHARPMPNSGPRNAIRRNTQINNDDFENNTMCHC